MLNIGYRAHDFGVFDTIDGLIDSIHEYTSCAKLHLAPHKTIRNLLPWTSWDEEYAISIKDRLESEGISIEVLGCTINPVHPDEDIRHSEIERYKKNLRLMHSFGASFVGTETGSWSADLSYSTETAEPYVYDIFLSSMDKMLNEAIKCNSIIGIEPASHNHTICTPERLARLLDRFDDEHLMVTLDPVNLIPICGIPESDGACRRIPSKEAQREYYSPLLHDFRERIAVIHAKDYSLTDQGLKKGNLTVLTGVFDWKGFLKEMRKEAVNVPIILENMDPKTLLSTVNKLNSMYDSD